MAETTISRVPKILDLELYAGDGIALRFKVTGVDDEPSPLDGVATSQIKGRRSDESPRLEWTVDDSEMATGIVVLSLTGEQTASLIVNGKTFSGVWDLQYQATGAEPLTFVQGKVVCNADVTH